MEGWTNPTLQCVKGQWRIYSDSGKVFVPIQDAVQELIDACPGAQEQRDNWNNEPF